MAKATNSKKADVLRLTQETASVSGTSNLIENLGWRTNSTLSSYAGTRIGTNAWNDSRNFQYNSRNQLINEPIGVTSSSSATNTYTFDTNKLGVLISAQWSGGLTNNWQGTALNSLAQITGESWNESGLVLRANGQSGNASGVAATLDGTKP